MASLVRLYLLAYNFSQLAAWSVVLLLALAALSHGGVAACFPAVNRLLTAAQLASGLETLHAALGLVRSQVAPNVVQFVGRTHCLLLLRATPAYFSSPFAASLAVVWSVADVVRYAFLLASTLTAPSPPPKFLRSLRYTAFLPLYPAGAAAEWALLYLARPSAVASGMWSFSLPNALNAGFSYPSFLLGVLCIYPPLFAGQYAHMLKQRAAKLKET